MSIGPHRNIIKILIPAFLLFVSCQHGDSGHSKQESSLKQIEAQMALLEEAFFNGELPKGAYEQKMDSLSQEAARLHARAKGLESVEELPEWAVLLGLDLPREMKLLPRNSFRTRGAGFGRAFNSVTMVFEGDYELAIREAKRIATRAGVPLDKSWEKNLMMNKRLGLPEIRGVRYSNLGPNRDTLPEYYISIRVEPSGCLTIEASDAAGMQALIRSSRSASGN